MAIRPLQIDASSGVLLSHVSSNSKFCLTFVKVVPRLLGFTMPLGKGVIQKVHELLMFPKRLFQLKRMSKEGVQKEGLSLVWVNERTLHISIHQANTMDMILS